MLKTERLTGPDALRGFALFGICVVNLPLIARSWQSYLLPLTDPIARGGLFINSWLFEAKFFGLFSFLFGFGMFVLLQNRGLSFVLRRLVLLFVFGLLHGILFFPGDILASYAILGTIFLCLRNLNSRTLVFVAAAFFLLSIGTFLVLGLVSGGDPHIPITNYLSSFGVAIASNATVYPITIGYVILFNWPLAFAMFCLGYVSGRKNLLALIATRKFSWLFLVLGLAGSLPYACAAAYKWKHEMVWAMPLMAMTSPLLSFTYAWVIIAIANRVKSVFIVGLAAAGKMSLTNYLAQSAIAGVIFHGYGFALYDKISYAGLIAVSAAIFLLQVLLSLTWLRFFATGPAEMLLRVFTYGELTVRRR